MMTSPLQIIRRKQHLRAQVKQWHQERLRVGMVPTMGALHHGHISLIKEIQKHVDKVVVSIFVNPKQFGPNEDFDKYPRQEAEDAKKLAEAETDLLYAPDVTEIYPDGFLTNVTVTKITEGLCAAKRPGHFDGVTTVVTKLLLQCLPDVALFGEKDFQQYTVLKQLANDLDIPTEVMCGKLIRDEDGLATSSRNVYLTPQEREIALKIPKVLQQILTEIAEGILPLQHCLDKGKKYLMDCGFREVQYLEVRKSRNLEPVTHVITESSRVLVAAVIGNVRLIDNMPIPMQEID